MVIYHELKTPITTPYWEQGLEENGIYRIPDLLIGAGCVAKALDQWYIFAAHNNGHVTNSPLGGGTQAIKFDNDLYWSAREQLEGARAAWGNFIADPTGVYNIRTGAYVGPIDRYARFPTAELGGSFHILQSGNSIAMARNRTPVIVCDASKELQEPYSPVHRQIALIKKDADVENGAEDAVLDLQGGNLLVALIRVLANSIVPEAPMCLKRMEMLKAVVAEGISNLPYDGRSRQVKVLSKYDFKYQNQGASAQ